MRYTRTPIATAAPFDLTTLREHARIDLLEDGYLLDLMGRTAAAEIEAHTDLALIAQTITATADTWEADVPLPVGPLYAAGLGDHPVTVQTRDDAGSLTDHATGWWIEHGRYPVLHLTDDLDGVALIVTYPAGFGLYASDIPADLQFAVADQVARTYDLRGAEDGTQGLSIAAARITARHRRVRA